MIRAGRDVVDRHGVAELHGLTPATAKRKKPWSAEGHPAPLSTRRPNRGHPQLWDKQQAEAYAAGFPVPPLPDTDAPEDLLDRFEAAALAEVSENYWRDYTASYDGSPTLYHFGPTPDAQPHGVAHWTRRTVLADKTTRAERHNPGGRPASRTSSPVIPQLQALLEHARNTGQPLPSTAEIAEELGVHPTTITRHLKTLTAGHQELTTP